MRGARAERDTRPTESVAIARFSGAALAQMMDCSPKLALRIRDQLISAGEAEKDRQQRPHLQPVQQQANRFKAHFSSPWHSDARKGSLQVPRSDLATEPRLGSTTSSQ